MNVEKKSYRKILLIISVISLTFCFFRVLFATQPKLLGTFPDEEVYLDMATSFINSGKFEIRNVTSNNTAILYSLILSPCMLISNVFIRNIAIGLFNSILLTSTVIPIYLMCKRLNYKSKTSIMIIISVLLLPDMTMSMTFMSENLFIPISAWLFYFITSYLIEKNNFNKIVKSCIVSLFAYLCFLTKTIALYYCIAFVLIVTLIFILEKENRKNNIYTIFSFTLTFFLLKTFFDYVVFDLIFGIKDSVYTSMIPDLANLLTIDNISYLFYAFIFCLICSLFAFMYFPVVIPLFSFGKLDRIHKYLLLFSTISLVAALGVIVVLIHNIESSMMLSMRQHLRYYSPLLILFLMIFYKLLIEDTEKITLFEKNGSKKPINIINFSILYLTLFYCVFKFYAFVGVDGVLLQGLNFWGRKFNLPNHDYGTFSFSIHEFVIKIAVICLIILGLYATYKITKRKKYILIAILFFACICNNIAAIKVFRTDYSSLNKTLIQSMKEVETIDRYLKKVNGNVLYISSTSTTTALETYLTRETYYTTINDIMNLKAEQEYLNLQTSKIICSYPHQLYENLNEIDYIIVPNNINISNATKIELPNMASLNLYKNNDVSKLYIDNANFFPDTVGESITLDVQNTRFYTQCSIDENGDFVSIENVSKPLLYGPYSYTKAGEYKVTFYYTYTGSETGEIGYVDLVGDTQRLAILPLYAVANFVTMESVNLENDFNQLELRMYANYKGIKFDRIEVQRLK